MKKTQPCLMISEQKEIMDRYTCLSRDELVTLLDKSINDLPESQRASVTFEVNYENMPYDETNCGIYMKFDRPESDKEYNERMTRQENAVQQQEARERQELERLSKKYKPK